MLRLFSFFLLSISFISASVELDLSKKVAASFNEALYLNERSGRVANQIAYVPYKLYEIRDRLVNIILAPSNCYRSANEESFLLQNCGFNREHHFYHVIAEKEGDRFIIKESNIFTKGEELLDIENYEILGIKSTETINSFYHFMSKFGKKYPIARDFNERFRNFKMNSKKISLIKILDPSAEYGHTQFSDLTYEEFSTKYLGYKNKHGFELEQHKPELDDKDLPESFDWRQHGAVTEVKNQGSCGSCWAFSVVGNVEGRYYLAKNKLLSLSEQELVDCDTLDQSCNGGLPLYAYESIKKIGGLTTETNYPYKAKKEDKCYLKKESIRVHLSNGIQISKDETDVAKELYKNGPVSMALNALFLQFYHGGVTHPPKCLCVSTSLNHAVLGVGFGVHVTSILHRHQPYWLVKNSWGKSWGESGYFKIYRGDGTCGINEMVTTGIISD